VLAVSGVLLALSSHSAKASTRLVVNASPEPVSNVAVSLSEDGLVFVVMALAMSRPELAVVVVALLTLASIVVAFVFYRIARRVGRRLRSGTRASTGRSPSEDDSSA
jgi:membrane protein DedA with SNARE-associated domain